HPQTDMKCNRSTETAVKSWPPVYHNELTSDSNSAIGTILQSQSLPSAVDLSKNKYLQQQLQKSQITQNAARMALVDGAPFNHLANFAANLYRQQMFQSGNGGVSLEPAGMFVRPQ